MGVENGPLKGIKVLDLGTMLAAPLAAAVLADQGAEVIKVEPPGFGDVMRFVGATRNGVSALFQGTNRGKRSLALDMKTPQGLVIVKQLVAVSDVLLHNFRPGVAERLGVDYESLKAVNPELIYLSVTGFGHRGPYAKRAAYDNVVQAFTGVAFSQANMETGEPTQYYQIFADKITALYASQALTAALLARERGAGGQHLQLAMADSVVSFMWPDVSGTATFLEEGATPGVEVAKGVPLIKFRNGYGQAAPVNDAHFHGWCKVFGVDSSAPELATVADRMSRKELMVELSAQIFARALEMDVDEAIAELEALDVPCAKAMHLAELPGHPQMKANGTFVESDHPRAGRIVEPKTPVNFSATPSSVGMPSASLGQHTDEILAELNYDVEAIKQLREKNIVG
jgi:crotonobetainyl-CoA:carnitine CoA-transferase CaiB-like acyl-CoA transferase